MLKSLFLYIFQLYSGKEQARRNVKLGDSGNWRLSVERLGSCSLTSIWKGKSKRRYQYWYLILLSNEIQYSNNSESVSKYRIILKQPYLKPYDPIVMIQIWTNTQIQACLTNCKSENVDQFKILTLMKLTLIVDRIKWRI